MLDNFSQILYSSTAEIFKRVEDYKGAGAKVEEAVEKVMKEVYRRKEGN